MGDGAIGREGLAEDYREVSAPRESTGVKDSLDYYAGRHIPGLARRESVLRARHAHGARACRWGMVSLDPHPSPCRGPTRGRKVPMRSRSAVALLLSVMIAACGRDLSSRSVAILSDSTLLVMNSDGTGRITIAHDVRTFSWLSDGDLQVVMRSFEANAEDSDFSVYRVPMTDIESFYRVGEAPASDTVPRVDVLAQNGLPPGFDLVVEGDSVRAVFPKSGVSSVEHVKSYRVR